MVKHGITLVFASAVILLFLSNGLCQAQNLVYNGGFEKQSSNSIAAGWHAKAYRGTNVRMSLDSGVKHSGAVAFKADFEGEGGRAMLYPDRDIVRVIPGRTYEVSLWVKAQNLDYSPNFIAPALHFNFSPTRISPYPIIDLITEMKGERDWKQLSLTGIAPPDAKKLSYKIMLTAGTIWIDDVSITEVNE